MRNAELVLTLSAQVAALQDEMDENHYALEEARSDLDSEKAALAEREIANHQLQATVEQLRDSLHVSSMKLKAANYEIDRLTLAWAKERDGVAALSKQLEEDLKRIELLNNTNNGLKVQIEEAGCKVKELKADNKELTNKLAEAFTEVNFLQSELQYLQDSLRASGNNFEDIINKARTTSRMSTTGQIMTDEPDDMAYTMEFERDTSTPPGSAPVGLNGVRTIRSGRASANTSVADNDEYQDDFGSPLKPLPHSADGDSRGVKFPDISAGNGDGTDVGRSCDADNLLDHACDRSSSCEEDGASCGVSRRSEKSGGSKRKGTKKKCSKKPCSECQNKYKGKGMRLPTTLHNVKVEDTPQKKQVAGEMGDLMQAGTILLRCHHLRISAL